MDSESLFSKTNSVRSLKRPSQQLDHKLRLEAELLAAIVSSSDDAIISKNLDGIITSWNQGAERIFGYTAKEAIGQPITLIIPSTHWEEEVDILSRLRRGERIDHFQTMRKRKDGGLLNISLTISPIRDSSGRVIGASKVARDITALKRTEENYRKLAETLEAEVLARTRELEDRNADVLSQAEQLRHLSWRLLRIQDEERRHIARELHDSAGQTLAVLALNISKLISDAKEQAPAMVQTAEETREIVQQLTQELRTTSYLLHPPLLDENGLRSALSWYVQGLTERSGLKINLDIPKDFGRLPEEMELVVFRLVQECLTNVHRHSGSKTASIRASRDPERISVEIQDQGRGMSPDKLAEVQSRSSGVGIRSMKERLRQFAGQLHIESDLSGTRILATIPIPGAPRQEPGDVETLRATG
jgi:PAS domain S-box-containing protein